MKVVSFNLKNLTFGIPLEKVDQVSLIVEFIRIPNTPEFIPGYINLCGELIPVFDPRIIFKTEKKEISLEDKLLIVKSHTLLIALWVDNVNEVVEISEKQLAQSKELVYFDQLTDSVVKTNENLIIISDPEKFLSRKELEKLHKTLYIKGKKPDVA